MAGLRYCGVLACFAGNLFTVLVCDLCVMSCHLSPGLLFTFIHLSLLSMLGGLLSSLSVTGYFSS